jgi:excisionase family DNA binding protein
MKLTTKQAAERIGVSAQLVYRWCDEKRLPHYRLGGEGRRGKILIEESDLDAFLASQKVMPTSSLPQGLRHIQQPS